MNRKATPIVMTHESGASGESVLDILGDMDKLVDNVTASGRDRRLDRIAKKVVGLDMGMDEILERLDDLEELSVSIDDMVDTFKSHYRMAGMDTEVKNQKDLLEKAKNGLQSCLEIRGSLGRILGQFPDDKNALKAMRELELMEKRFTRHKEDASEIVRVLSKKLITPALKELGSKIKKELVKRLVDPDSLKVETWQYEQWNGDLYAQIYFTINDGKTDRRGVISENLSKKGGPKVDSVGGSSGFVRDVSPKEFADMFFIPLKGWSGLLGEDEAQKNRAGSVLKISNVIETVLRRMHSIDVGQIEVNESGTSIEGSYRSNLPKEGARSVGEDRYDEMVDNEKKMVRGVLMPLLQPYMSVIERVSIQDEEKSWVSIIVELK